MKIGKEEKMKKMGKKEGEDKYETEGKKEKEEKRKRGK